MVGLGEWSDKTMGELGEISLCLPKEGMRRGGTERTGEINTPLGSPYLYGRRSV